MQVSTAANSPCKDCTKRQLHCHSKCKAYAEYKQKLEIAREKENKRAEENNFNYAERRAVRKIMRGKR